MLQVIFRDDPKFQKIVRWPWLHVTDKQSEIQIAGVCSREVIQFLETNYTHYQGLILFLKEVLNPLFWTSYERERMSETHDASVFRVYERTTKVLQFLQHWRSFFEHFRRKDGHGVGFFITDNALRTVQINHSALGEIVNA